MYFIYKMGKTRNVKEAEDYRNNPACSLNKETLAAFCKKKKLWLHIVMRYGLRAAFCLAAAEA